MKNQKTATKKYTKFVVLILAAVLFLAVGLLINWFSRQNVEAAKSSPPEEIDQASALSEMSASAQNDGVDIIDTTPMEIPAKNAILTQTVNNIDISIDNFRREGDKFLIDVRFDLPDDADWTIWNSYLSYGGKVYKWSEWAPIEIREPPVDGKQKVYTFPPAPGRMEVTLVDAIEGQKGYRFDTIYFDEVPTDPDSTHYTFTIDAIVARPYEGEECTQAYLEKAQAFLDAKKTGIKVKCITEEYHSGLEIADKPESMSMEEAQSILNNNDFYLGLNGIKGPWIFEFEIK